jgi:biotin carboxyl carrier protein
MANIIDVPGASRAASATDSIDSTATSRLAQALLDDTPRSRRFRGGVDVKKWRARLTVLLMIALAVFGGSKLAQARNIATAQLDLGAVTLTAQAIPVESIAPGRVTAVDVQAQQRVTAGQRLGTLLTMTTSSSGAPRQKTVVLTAPSDGIVISDPTPAGTALQSGQPFVEIYDPVQLAFVATVKAQDLTKLSRGMVATLKADGLPRPVTAVVDRAVPQVVQAGQVGQTATGSGQLQLVLVPKRSQDVAQLVPGLRFTGKVDTTSASGPRLTGLSPTQ